jgi:uncharacterized protein (DUF2141 family)
MDKYFIRVRLTILALVILTFAFSNRTIAQNQSETLTVKINSKDGHNGKIIVNLYNKQVITIKDPFRQITLKTGDKHTVTFTNLQYADYSVMAFLDENNNNELDHSLGFPAEPLGWSNNWRFGLFTGMPMFDKTKFTFSEKNNAISITLN